MPEIRSSLEIALELPTDLREWIDESTLVRLVFETLHVFEQEQCEASSDRRLPIGQPRVLLTLLTYSYAVGVYGSQEIERQIPFDPQLLYLAAKSTPLASQLRQFRRYHRFWLQRSLSRLLQSTWSIWRGCPVEEGGPGKLFDWAAEQRINQAVLTDTMALDE